MEDEMRLFIKAQLNRSGLHQEKVNVKGKKKQYQGTRWKRGVEQHAKEHPRASEQTSLVPQPKAGTVNKPKSQQKGQGPRGGGPIPQDPSLFGNNKPEHKLGKQGEGLKPTGSFHQKGSSKQWELPEEAASWKQQTIHTLSQITDVYGRRKEGEGKQIAIASPEDLEVILKNTKFACISAGRNPDDPEDQKLTEQQIGERYKELKKRAGEMGFMYTDSIGKYGGEEETIMVMVHDADVEDALSLGKEFKQQSVMVADHGNGKVVRTTGAGKNVLGEGKGYEYVQDADDFYTSVQTGSAWMKFRFNIEFMEKALRFVRMMFGRIR
jgi:hypothetical protein